MFAYFYIIMQNVLKILVTFTVSALISNIQNSLLYDTILSKHLLILKNQKVILSLDMHYSRKFYLSLDR